MNQLLMISVIAVALSVLAIVQSFALSSFSSAQRFTLYRVELGFFLSFIFFPGSKFLWKRMVKDVLGGDSSTPLQIFLKFFVAIVFGLAHLFPLSNILIVEEPVFNVLCWVSFGILSALLIFFGTVKVVINICKPCLRCLDFSNRYITISALFFSAFSIWIAYGIATRPPAVIR